MKKVMIIGCPGSGKSTFAQKLSTITNIPLYHLDMIWHNPDKTKISKDEFDQNLDEIFKQKGWIIDGNYQRTIEKRLKECDTVYLLDIPVDECIKGVENRIGKKREDMPWVETEFTEEFKQLILNFSKEKLPKIYELLKQYSGSKQIIVFKSREEIDEHLKFLKSKYTIVYLIRHAETVNENGIRNTDEDSQLINEKEILSVKGEEQARKLSEHEELKNIDVIWSSSFVRAKATAKYIAHRNNLQINLDNRINERKLGNLKELGEFMKDKNTRDPSQEQLLEREFKTSDGESAEKTKERMKEFFDMILKEYDGKRISVVSHRRFDKIFLIKLV